MQTESYVVLRPFMVEELGLKGSELVAYALIYGFSLIAIPKELHRRYHETMTNLELSIVSGGDGSIKDVFMVGMSNGACNMDVMLMSDMIEATSDLSKFVADNQRRFYETLMQRSVESGISEIFLQNM